MIDVKDLKKGMRVFECEYGTNLGVTIIEDASEVNEPLRQGWVAKAKTDEGEEFEFFHNPKYGAYAPKIYAEKQYISRAELDEIVKSAKMTA